jgi:hypothetical protein
MNYKKPVPIFAEVDQRICPVCGKQSYSAGGIHPQCAVKQADAPREQRLKAKKKLEAQNKPKVKKPPQAWNQKNCPKCGAKVHVRKKTCGCGFDFPSN